MFPSHDRGVGRVVNWDCGCQHVMRGVEIVEQTDCIPEQANWVQVNGDYGKYEVEISEIWAKGRVVRIECGTCMQMFPEDGIHFMTSRSMMKWFCPMCEKKMREQWEVEDKRAQARQCVKEYESRECQAK